MTSSNKNNLFTPARVEKIQHATTYWLFRLLTAVLLISLVVLPALRIILGALPIAAWSLIWMLLLAQLAVLIVVAVDGRWDEDSHRVQVDSLVLVLLISIPLGGFSAYWNTLVLGEDSLVYNLGYIALAVGVTTMIVTAHVMERRMG